MAQQGQLNAQTGHPQVTTDTAWRPSAPFILSFSELISLFVLGLILEDLTFPICHGNCMYLRCLTSGIHFATIFLKFLCSSIKLTASKIFFEQSLSVSISVP